MDQIELHLARNLGTSEFCKMTGVPLASLKDWRNRNMAPRIGQIGPNNRWLYSRSDIASVAFASELVRQKFEWRVSLEIGSAISALLQGRMSQPEEPFYQANYMAFAEPDSDVVHWGCGASGSDALERLKAACEPEDFKPIISHLFEITDFVRTVAMNPLAHGRDCIPAV